MCFCGFGWSNTSNRGVLIHDVQVQKEQHDPPDFWVRIDGNQFAVEETSIVVQGTVTQNPAGSKWEGEAQHELAGLIQNAVSQKRSKLEKSGVPQQCRDIILLLYDAYMYGSTEDAKLALRKRTGPRCATVPCARIPGCTTGAPPASSRWSATRRRTCTRRTRPAPTGCLSRGGTGRERPNGGLAAYLLQCIANGRGRSAPWLAAAVLRPAAAAGRRP